MARILYVRIDVTREKASSKTRPHNDRNSTGSHVRKKPAIINNAANEHLRPIIANIGRKGPVPGYAKNSVTSDYIANNADRGNYRHRKRQKHVIHIINAIFEQINDRYRAVNIVAQRY
jgi:hypothetical protein